MRRGFTLIEILSVIGVAAIVAALSFPVFVSVKKSSKRTACMSNLRQIGLAIAIYRSDYDGTEQGTPSEMGLPPDFGAPAGGRLLKLRCLGDKPNQGGYYFNYPEPGLPDEAMQDWSRYVGSVGQSAILYFDPNHQSSYPRSLRWENWTVLGLRLDGSVTVRTRRGFPLFRSWWHR